MKRGTQLAAAYALVNSVWLIGFFVITFDFMWVFFRMLLALPCIVVMLHMTNFLRRDTDHTREKIIIAGKANLIMFGLIQFIQTLYPTFGAKLQST